MSNINSLLTTLLGQLGGTNTSTTTTKPNEYTQTDLQNIFTRSDSNNDGSVSLAELNSLIKSDARYTDVNYDLANQLKVNFAAIADNALQNGETQAGGLGSAGTKTDTIEMSELTKINGFDGDSTTVTKDDFDALQNGNTASWPTTTTTNTNNNNSTEMQLLQVLLLVLLSGYGTGGSGSGGSYPPVYPQPVYPMPVYPYPPIYPYNPYNGGQALM